MSFSHTTELRVEFGDCDPAGIVFYPNFFRWMDAATWRFFDASGAPSWRDASSRGGVPGAPLVDASAHFERPANFGDTIAIDTSIAEWRGRSFVLRHVIRRGETVLAEGREVRVFARRHPDDPSRIQAIDMPSDIRKRVE